MQPDRTSAAAAGAAPRHGAAAPRGSLLTWPALTAASLAGYGMLVGPAGLSYEAALQVHFLILFPGIFLLERMMPYHRAWNGFDRQSFNDFAYNFTFTGAQVAAASAALFLIGRTTGPKEADLFGLAGIPFLAQCAVFAVLADLIYYIYHRAFHTWGVLWRLHAIHHSSTQLHILNNARVHPLEVFVAFTPIVGFAYLIEAPVDVVSWFLALQLTVGLLTHSNIAVTSGPCAWIFNTPELHHWHHSRDRREQDNNYASTLMLWDHLFGTYYNPRGRHASQSIGTTTEVPPGLIQQLRFPFTRTGAAGDGDEACRPPPNSSADPNHR
ncbi:MAG TPA: sterol desaturase family protein [Allosphingosinicella sp.]|jgi:sterol desaturase/sphingolipid hydroxylase (fatty acid hydroxylase superfamily)